jgi:hypothetical protein
MDMLMELLDSTSHVSCCAITASTAASDVPVRVSVPAVKSTNTAPAVPAEVHQVHAGAATDRVAPSAEAMVSFRRRR